MKQENLPLVSIITPCYNGESFLDRYFQSILKQTYAHLELVFINDGSSDRTEEIALGYRDQLEKRGIKYIYRYQENQGQAAALNNGLKVFTGDYLTWPDSDDEMTPDCIEKKMLYLQAHPDISMVRCTSQTDQAKISVISENTWKEPADIFDDLFHLKNYFGCGCYMISTSLFLDCYPDRDIFVSRRGQNWQLLLPAASRSLCGIIDEPLYIIHEHDDSHSRKKRTPLQEWERWDGFTDILIEAVKVSRCDQEKYFREALRMKAEQHFYYAVTTKDKDLMRHTYQVMSFYKKPSLHEKLLLVKKLVDSVIR